MGDVKMNGITEEEKPPSITKGEVEEGVRDSTIAVENIKSEPEAYNTDDDNNNDEPVDHVKIELEPSDVEDDEPVDHVKIEFEPSDIEDDDRVACKLEPAEVEIDDEPVDDVKMEFEFSGVNDDDELDRVKMVPESSDDEPVKVELEPVDPLDHARIKFESDDDDKPAEAPDYLYLEDLSSFPPRPRVGAKFACDFCPRKFATAIKRARHSVHEHARERPAWCAGCGHVKGGAMGLARHTDCKSKERCAECGAAFTRPSKLKAHANATHRRRPRQRKKPEIACNVCGVQGVTKSFNPRSFVVHMLSEHCHMVPFRCFACERFVDHRDRAEHMRSHIEPLSYECNLCPSAERMYRPAKWRAHARRHFGAAADRLACSACSLRFDTAAALERHVCAAHFERLPYACGACPRTASTRAAMLRHVVGPAHSAPAHYWCGACGHRPRHWAALERHVATHAAPAAYGCVRCGARFVGAALLARHSRAEHGGAQREVKCRRLDK